MSLLTRHRSTLPVIVCIVCTAVVAAAFWFGFEPLRRLEFGARDFLARHGTKPPARPDLVFLAIDQASVDLVNQEHALPDSCSQSVDNRLI